MLDDLKSAVPVAVALGFAGLVYGVPVWQSWRRPKSDIPRIKRSLDGETHRVLSITPDGTAWSGGRAPTVYRRYRVVTKGLDGSELSRCIDLEPSLFSDDTLWEWKNGARHSLNDSV